MGSDVTIETVLARPTAVIAAATSWQEFPVMWRQLSGEVWACLRASGIERGCPNVILYRDSTPTVEVGVLLDQPCALSGRVVFSTLPGGTVARTIHRGPFTDLGGAHDALRDWCAHQDLRLTGTRWEVYGPHHDDPALQWTEICWLVAEPEE
jgi:effector-binding domain-containing protein